MLSFESTVAALVESLGRDTRNQAGGEAAQPVHFDGAARYVLATHARMPDYLRLPLRVLTLAFDAWAIPRTGRPFHKLPHEQRLAQVKAWQASKLEARRRLVEFYGALGIFGLYSELYGTQNDRESQNASRKVPTERRN